MKSTRFQSPTRKAHLSDAGPFAEIKGLLEADYPSVKFSEVEVNGDTTLRADHGGMKVFWLYQGDGEVFLPKGYRTQEGGNQQLPDSYEPDKIDPKVAELLDKIQSGIASVSQGAAPHVKAILGRRQDDIYIGDFPAELWGLEHVPKPWAENEQVEAALVTLFDVYRSVGYSTKQSDSFEPIMAGDQLTVCGKEEVRVRGQFRCFAAEKTDQPTGHISTTRRLRYLLDTAGGCSFDFDPYRRLPLTWYLDYPGQADDGVNFANSHVVNIPQELSSTHFHPMTPLVGGVPQTEMYLVLDPKFHGLDEKGRKASILLFPDLKDLSCYEEFDLSPGDLVYIPPGVGHRGLDVFVNVLTIPGFKPHNEFYIDQDILDRTDGKSPYNEEGLARKNYDRLDDLL